MTADPSTPRDPGSVEQLRAALQRIKAECGRVCANFELCTHVACQSSVAVWMIADAALNGETPESANARAAADHATSKEQP